MQIYLHNSSKLQAKGMGATYRNYRKRRNKWQQYIFTDRVSGKGNANGRVRLFDSTLCFEPRDLLTQVFRVRILTIARLGGWDLKSRSRQGQRSISSAWAWYRSNAVGLTSILDRGQFFYSCSTKHNADDDNEHSRHIQKIQLATPQYQFLDCM